MTLRVSRRALGAFSLARFAAIAWCVTAVAGCSSSSSPSSTPTTTTTPPAAEDAVLSGSYTTMADAYGGITRYSFDDDGTYKMARIPCDATAGACSDQGTYTVDTSYDSVTFVSTVTGASTTSALAIDDVNDGDDDDAGAGATTTKDLVTGDAGSLFGGAAAGKTAQSFVLASAGSALFTHESPVLDQLGTSNCWIYTAMGWSAALANFATPSVSHQYSPAYIYYWHQFDELTNAAQLVRVSGHNQISWGGYWSQATAYALQYGMMNYGAFVSDDAKVSESALTAINKSLKTGPLSKTGALSNRTLVRSELDKAWGLSGAVIGALDATFGADVSKDFTKGATAPSNGSIFVPAKVTAELTNGGALSVGLLNAAIGTPEDDDMNKGALAWTNFAYPAASTNYTRFQPLLTKIVKVLNDGFAIPFEWYADSDSEGTDGSFKKAASASNPSDGGLHYSIIADYQMTNVPGFGTLSAGSTRTAAQKTAALDPAARVSFLRIKNSWGTMQGNAGYNDLYIAYIDGNAHVCTSKAKSSCYSQQIIDHVVLPPGY